MRGSKTIFHPCFIPSFSAPEVLCKIFQGVLFFSLPFSVSMNLNPIIRNSLCLSTAIFANNGQKQKYHAETRLFLHIFLSIMHNFKSKSRGNKKYRLLFCRFSSAILPQKSEKPSNFNPCPTKSHRIIPAGFCFRPLSRPKYPLFYTAHKNGW